MTLANIALSRSKEQRAKSEEHEAASYFFLEIGIFFASARFRIRCLGTLPNGRVSASRFEPWHVSVSLLSGKKKPAQLQGHAGQEL